MQEIKESFYMEVFKLRGSMFVRLCILFPFPKTRVALELINISEFLRLDLDNRLFLLFYLIVIIF